jgi:hypothetical protein
VRTEDIKTAEPFESLFPIDQKTYAAIYDDMKAHGYDSAYPVILWAEGGCVLDGHTRLSAASELKLDVPVLGKSFATEDEAVAYAIHCQRDRRNLSAGDIIRFMMELDKRRPRGGDRKSQESITSRDVIDRSAKDTAEIIGVSASTVERARVVIDHGTPEIKEAVAKGEMSIFKASKESLKAKKEAETDESEPKGKSKSRVQESYSDGLMYCRMAISQMERIHRKDQQRAQAFAKMQSWLDFHK